MFDILFVIGGLIFLFLGGDGLIRGSVTIAEKLNLSTLLISTIVIGFGTSAPELLVSIDAALEGFPEIALGNVIGSNISNIFLVLGIAASISTIPCLTSQIRRDAIVGMAASVFLALLSLSGYIHRFTGLAMFASLIAYLSYIIWSEKNESKLEKKKERKLEIQIEKEMVSKNISLSLAVFMTLISFIFLVIGARLLVDGAVSIAKDFGISKAVIGLTLVAVGTSLPELVTACIASWRKHSDVVIGNILGSNLFNILSIVGITAFIKPISFKGQIAQQDVWIMLATSALLISVILSRKQIGRLEGKVFLILYAMYIVWLYL